MQVNITGHDPAEQEQAQFVLEVLQEMARAKAKFPSPAGSMTAFFEEAGELAKAMLDEPRAKVRAEAVQCCVMAMRVALEGDPTLDAIRAERGAEEDAPVKRKAAKLAGKVVDRLLGPEANTKACSECHGSGRVPYLPASKTILACRMCNGTGRTLHAPPKLP